jgi:Subtilase family
MRVITGIDLCNHFACPLFGRTQARLARFAVVDSFGSPSVDIDGDGEPDLSHGEVVCRFIKAQNPFVEILKFNAMSNYQIIEAFGQISAMGNIDAVNLSKGFLIPIVVEASLQCKGLAEQREILAKRLQAYKSPLVKAIEQLCRKGIPVYIAAGNNGPKSLNINSLAEGSINVSATDKHGNRESYCTDNPFVNRWEQGTYPIRKVPGGFDITGYGKADVLDQEVTGHKSLLNQFIGLPLRKTLAKLPDDMPLNTPSDYKAFRRLMYDKVFSCRELVKRGIAKKLELYLDETFGNYVILDPRSSLYAAGYLTVNAKGLLTVKREKWGSPNGLVEQLFGTSWSAPTALGKDSRFGFSPP